jgi:predicted Zn finger-like uncharacterized protein
MRLICPNCDAQYEVDASLIPLDGRDVQCSDCGHVWFQYPDGAEPDLPEDSWPDVAEPDAAVPEAPEVQAEQPPEAAPEPEPEPEPDEAPFLDDSAQDADPGDDGDLRDDPDDDEPDPGVLKRHTMDESLLAVLREEAEHEARARAEEAARAASRLETQPDLGLTEADDKPRLRIRPRATPAPTPEDALEEDIDETMSAAAVRAARAPRRELLPDIEQINSTLRASGATRKGETAEDVRLPDLPEPRRAGFRRGFVTVLALAAVGTAIYVQAPRLGAVVPQAVPVLDVYVAGVDKARSGLDGLVRGLLLRLKDEG